MTLDVKVKVEFGMKTKARGRHKTLSDLEKQVAILALLNGLTNREIANELDIGYPSVVCAMYRAQKKVEARSHRQGYARILQLINGRKS